ncbi:MAG: NAD(P)H-hydrate epimerase [Chloroflexota bacterium]|nr:NAD(P)H-hydrate epimerase [Chloroflexota bacterium]
MAEPIRISQRQWQLPELPIADDPIPFVDRQTMLAADRIATDRIGISLLQMMENAGLQLAELTRLTLGGVAGRSIVILAGTGNNAGGGMVAARRLAGWGADVCVIFARPLLRLRPGPCAQVEPMLAAGVRAAVAGHDLPHAEIAGEVMRAGAVIDALIGYSLHGPPDDAYGPLIGLAGLGSGPVISLDIPSGIDASTGERPGSAVHADATLALALPKAGMTLGEGRRFSGVGFLADIGLPVSIFTELGIPAGPWFAHGPLVRLG